MSAELEVPQSTLTSLIDRLEQRGLVRRAINPRDKRSYLIELTPAGQEVQGENHRVDRLIVAHMLEALPDETSRRQFIHLLLKESETMQSQA